MGPERGCYLTACRAARKLQAGFTLLEVLAAFVVSAFTLAVLLQLFSAGLRDAQLADEFARANALAQSNLAGYSATEQLGEGASSGSDGPFEWEVLAMAYDETKESPDGAAQPELPSRLRLLELQSSVRWRAADGRDRDVRLATLVVVSKP